MASKKLYKFLKTFIYLAFYRFIITKLQYIFLLKYQGLIMSKINLFTSHYLNFFLTIRALRYIFLS